MVTWEVPQKNPGHETDEGVWMKETAWQISHFAFSSVVMADRCDVEVIVKLGGCAVTQKNTFETVKHDAILAAAKLVKQINGKCIVIHGAG